MAGAAEEEAAPEVAVSAAAEAEVAALAAVEALVALAAEAAAAVLTSGGRIYRYSIEYS